MDNNKQTDLVALSALISVADQSYECIYEPRIASWSTAADKTFRILKLFAFDFHIEM